MVFVIVITLLIIKKDYYYANSISINCNMGTIVVEKNRINDIKEINRMNLGNMIVNYNIEKIQEIEDIYLVDVSFNEEIEINTNIYKIVLFKENILEYIIRIMKGDFKWKN